MRKTITTVLFITLFFGCAGIYHPIQPNTLNYNNVEIREGVSYSYRFDVLPQKGNKKYVKKAAKYNIDIVAVKIINNTDRELDFNKDIQLYVGNKISYPLESTVVTSQIKQGVVGYLLYGLLFFQIHNNNSTTTLPVGLGIGIGNMIAASSNNEKFKKEFSTYNLVNKTIAPGETVYGLVALRDIGQGALEIKITD